MPTSIVLPLLTNCDFYFIARNSSRNEHDFPFAATDTGRSVRKAVDHEANSLLRHMRKHAGGRIKALGEEWKAKA
jgi:hypothetical protein